MVDVHRIIVALVIAALIFGYIMVTRRLIRAQRRRIPHIEERPPLTKEDLLSALQEERQLAKRDARTQLVINIILTVFSLVAGWLLSGLVHLPGQH